MFMSMDTTEATKVCTKCGEEKEFGEFSKCKIGKFGLAARCKKCDNEYHKKYREVNRESIKEQNYEYIKTRRRSDSTFSVKELICNRLRYSYRMYSIAKKVSNTSIISQ